MDEPLRPQHFITRQNGIMVPLIAADELPTTLSIRGVPRTLTPHDTSGMTGIGTVNARHRQYTVDGLNRGFQTPLLTGDMSLLGSSFANADIRPPRNQTIWSATRDSPFPRPPKAFGIQEQPPSSPKTPFANMAASPTKVTSEPPPLDLPPFHNIEELGIGRAPGVKEYCSYWLRRGECDYAQQGCLYRHEMPLDREVLFKLGMRDIPKWYRERHQLASYLGLPSSGFGASSTKPGLMERSWRNPAAETVLEGSDRKTGKQTEVPASSKGPPPQRNSARLGANHVLAPQTPLVYTPKPQYKAMISRYASAPPKPKDNSRDILSSSEQQLRETIRTLDLCDQREKERLAKKSTILSPKKRDTAVPVNTPSSTMSTASSTTDADPESDSNNATADALIAQQARVREAAKAAKAVNTATSPLPRPVNSVHDVHGSNGKKVAAGGRGSRRNGGGRKSNGMGAMVDAKCKRVLQD